MCVFGKPNFDLTNDTLQHNIIQYVREVCQTKIISYKVRREREAVEGRRGSRCGIEVGVGRRGRERTEDDGSRRGGKESLGNTFSRT
jgi:hypothetical protein